jgi:hypothetical protein
LRLNVGGQHWYVFILALLVVDAKVGIVGDRGILGIEGILLQSMVQYFMEVACLHGRERARDCVVVQLQGLVEEAVLEYLFMQTLQTS